MQVTVHAPAKINLTLDVVGRREDGYHLLESIFQAVDCQDTLTARAQPQGITLTVAGGEPCPMEKNTAYKAAAAFFRHTGIDGGVAMTLEKRIPQQAGMGGGSADGAAALLALDALYDTHLSSAVLNTLALQVGADVPFCLLGGTAYVRGIGEQIQPLPALPCCTIVVAQPAEGVSTAAAYGALDAAEHLRRPDHTAALAALERGDLTGLCKQVENVFEAVVALDGVAAIRERMEAFTPLCSRMTGSGSAVFAVFTEEEKATACLKDLQKDWPAAFLCHPCNGPTVIVDKIV
ncbi:MAG: 4-(cytidine 5'-diphospho)-2-C-methyl-D-erythritol kinase [Clostridia bacterium]|nr:4-(cytidine 5'-diphospho)-2-C-methyl-D-erythritol kinase [Clostridia bacterium]